MAGETHEKIVTTRPSNEPERRQEIETRKKSSGKYLASEFRRWNRRFRSCSLHHSSAEPGRKGYRMAIPYWNRFGCYIHSDGVTPTGGESAVKKKVVGPLPRPNRPAEQAGDGQARSRCELIDFPDSNLYSLIEVAHPDRAAMPQTFCAEIIPNRPRSALSGRSEHSQSSRLGIAIPRCRHRIGAGLPP